jgi:DNA-binding PadR family transcriptional regulator
LAILEVLSRDGKGHKFNLLGRPHQSGRLEHFFGIRFNHEDRVWAGRAFDDLKRDDLIEPTYTDIADPENWVQITELGKEALARRALDDLDRALNEIDPRLVELRAGAWAAVQSAQPDTLRQAAHSGRELINQTLKILAPDEEVREGPGFERDGSSRSGITRRHRIKFAMRKRRARVSSSDVKIADKACDLVVATSDKLSAAAHARDMPEGREVIDALRAAEIALRLVLV